ncbi:MAG: hypothetical protein KDK11_15925 [Maritimibacter sp.]|nr:hypothetical protein [Maritimibacter sp.]
MPLRHIPSANRQAAPDPRRAADRIFSLVDMGKKAMPKNLVEREDGSLLVNKAVSSVAAVADALPLSSEISTLIDLEGRVILDPPWKSAGASVHIDAAIAASSRAVGAGAHLIVVDPNAEPIPIRKGVAFQYTRARLASLDPATFAVVDFDADPNAKVSVSPRPVSEVEVDPDDMVSYAFAFQLNRRELKATPPEHLAGEILWPISMGLGQVCDAAIFAELSAQAPNPWALGKAAAAGIPFGELRALVGTGGTGAQATEGALFVDGIPAELTADTAGTFVGAWSRAAIAINPDINLLLKRTSAAGELEVTCWVDMKAYVPDASKFWSVAP